MGDEELRKVFEGKNILVTGGAGSIGSELVKHLLKYGPEVVRVLDINETGLFDLEQQCAGYEPKLRMLVGDVRDKERLSRAMENIDFVFHAAALKHVYINEYTPSEAIKTNVLGTQNVIDAAIANNVKKVITISTDKAVNPTNVMGTTKLLAEKLTTAAQYHRGSSPTTFASVRFGNVLVSRGSVVPLFLEQIKKGGPVTVTDPRMTRFIMSTNRAIELILKATSIVNGGEIFILRMPSVKINDLAEVLIENYSHKYGQSSENIKIKLIGVKAGEKVHESLITDYEKQRAKLLDNDLIVLEPLVKARRGLERYKDGDIGNNQVPEGMFNNSSKEKVLTKDEIKKLLENLEI